MARAVTHKLHFIFKSQFYRHLGGQIRSNHHSGLASGWGEFDDLRNLITLPMPKTIPSPHQPTKIDALAKRYIGKDKYPGPADEIRVTYRVKPQHVLTFG